MSSANFCRFLFQRRCAVLRKMLLEEKEDRTWEEAMYEVVHIGSRYYLVFTKKAYFRSLNMYITRNIRWAAVKRWHQKVTKTGPERKLL